ncbi:MAG: membrane-bound lytic murein transglycosylase B [Enterobacterales bacterium]|jgi:membrane-bound lytic murein transglycosylase B
MKKLSTGTKVFAHFSKVTFVFALILLQTLTTAETTKPFGQWLAELRDESTALGVSETTIDLAFSEITAPVKDIIKKDRSQPEVVQTYNGYLSARVNTWKKEKGQKLLNEHRALLKEIAQAFGVQPRFIVAIWGMETNYGTFQLKESVFNVLATLAYDTRRGKFFRAQFLAAIRMLDSDFPDYNNMKSSWAGAMGQPQFMPDSYFSYAVDYDKDGKKDIWETKADIFASIANYFKTREWRDDQTWGRLVLLPANGEKELPGKQAEGLSPAKACGRFKSLGVWRDLQEWQELGVRKEFGADLPKVTIPAALILGDPNDNKGYLVYQNFCTIMSYNPSFKYALSIGLLSDLFDDK